MKFDVLYLCTCFSTAAFSFVGNCNDCGVELCLH